MDNNCATVLHTKERKKEKKLVPLPRFSNSPFNRKLGFFPLTFFPPWYTKAAGRVSLSERRNPARQIARETIESGSIVRDVPLRAEPIFPSFHFLSFLLSLSHSLSLSTYLSLSLSLSFTLTLCLSLNSLSLLANVLPRYLI